MFVDANCHIANHDAQRMSCATCVNLAHHTLSFPGASSFPTKREPQPPLTESYLEQCQQNELLSKNNTTIGTRQY